MNPEVQMRSLHELIDRSRPAWPEVRTWIAQSNDRCETLPVDRKDGERTLLALQVTTRSPLGAMALETGGLLIDHTWLRVLGGGSTQLTWSLSRWNELEAARPEVPPPLLVIAYDVVGGFFAVNGGGLGEELGRVYYFAPDTLAWEDLRFAYSGFLRWALAGDLEKFYAGLRWSGWQDDVRALGPDDGMTIQPPLWTREGKTGPVRRAVAPMKELWRFGMEARRQLEERGIGPGDAFRIVVKK